MDDTVIAPPSPEAGVARIKEMLPRSAAALSGGQGKMAALAADDDLQQRLLGLSLASHQ